MNTATNPGSNPTVLSIEEIDDIWAACSDTNSDELDMHEYARAIESTVLAKLAGKLADADQGRIEFCAAIDFAIEQGTSAHVFLVSWQEGDVSEWPEFEAAITKRSQNEYPDTLHIAAVELARQQHDTITALEFETTQLRARIAELEAEVSRFRDFATCERDARQIAERKSDALNIVSPAGDQ